MSQCCYMLNHVLLFLFISAYMFLGHTEYTLSSTRWEMDMIDTHISLLSLYLHIKRILSNIIFSRVILSFDMNKLSDAKMYWVKRLRKSHKAAYSPIALYCVELTITCLNIRSMVIRFLLSHGMDHIDLPGTYTVDC